MENAYLLGQFVTEALSVKIDSTLLEVLDKINSGGYQFAIAVGNHDSFRAVITDGDIRRALLNGLSLKDRVSELLPKDSHWLASPSNSESAAREMRSLGIRQLPVLSSDGRLEGVYVVGASFQQARIDDVLGLVLAGGRGERLRPTTDDVPKPLLEVDGRPLLRHSLDSILRAGITQSVISINYLGEMIRQYIEESEFGPLEIAFVEENEPLGTAGPLSLLDLAPRFEHVLVVNADVLHEVELPALLEAHRASGAAATAVTISHPVTVPFGVVASEDDRILRIEEKPTLEFQVLAGIYVIARRVISHVQASSRVDMPELLLRLVAENELVRTFGSNARWVDVGTPSKLEFARKNWLKN